MIDRGLKEKWARAASEHYARAHKAQHHHRDFERFLTFIDEKIEPKTKNLPEIKVSHLKIPQLMELFNARLTEIYDAEMDERTSPNKETGTQKIVKSLQVTLSADLK